MPTIDYTEVGLEGLVKYGAEDIGEAYYDGERLWPFKSDLLYSGGIDGESYPLADLGAYSIEGPAIANDSVFSVLGEKELPLSLGPERVINSTFTNSTGWILGSGWSISGGTAQCIDPTSQTDFNQLSVFELGKYYFIELNVTSVFSTTSNAPGLGGFDGIFYTANKIKTFQFIAGKTTATLLRLRAAASTGTYRITKISVKEILTNLPARQTSIAARPRLGSAPVTYRNLLERTEEMDQTSVWSYIGATVSANVINSPAGDLSADKLIETTDTSQHVLLQIQILPVNTSYALSVYAKEGERRYIALGSNTLNNNAAYVAFDLRDGVAGLPYGPLAGSITSYSIESLPDGWMRCRVVLGSGTGNISPRFVVGLVTSITPTAISGLSPQSYAGDGVSGVYLWGAQLEEGLGVTAYQKVGASSFLVTEEGVPNYPFIRFDLFDDILRIILDTAVSGDVVASGRQGTVITPVSFASGTQFDLGPTTHTNGEVGLLRAIGDVVGWMIFNKTLSIAERGRLMRYLKRRGAKGLLEEGATELITNGTFDSNLTGWTTTASVSPASVVWSNGVALFQTDGVAAAQMRRNFTLVLQRIYRVSYTGNVIMRIGTSENGTQYGTLTTGGSALFRAASPNFWISCLSTVNGSFADNISIKEVRPEEDWP